jgi:hypothetical protein
MKKKQPAPKPRRRIAVRDVKPKADPKGGLTAPIKLVSSAFNYSPPTLTAKGTGDVAMEEIVLSSERLDLP